ncbi:MAG: immunoglobulin-like domain-containing protein [Rhodothermales bacterium]
MFLLFLGGCDLLSSDASGEIVLTTVGDVYAPGEAVMLLIENGTSRIIGFNLCAAAVEYQTEGRWHSATENTIICPGILYTLKPGRTLTNARQLCERLPAGTYRIRGTFGTVSDESENGEPFETATSNTFTVQG